MKLMHGDELRLRLKTEKNPWSGVGHVIKIPDSELQYRNIIHDTYRLRQKSGNIGKTYIWKFRVEIIQIS